MSADGEEVRWHRDHGYDENPEAATNWDNYTELWYQLDPDNAVETGIPVFGATGAGQLPTNASGELMSIDVDPQDRIWYISRGDYFGSQGDTTCQVGFIEPPYSLVDAPGDVTPAEEGAYGNPTVALELDVMIGGATEADSGEVMPSIEMGGQGIAIDPNFEENGHVYVFYMPASPDYDTWDNPYNENIVNALYRISRFKWSENGGRRGLGGLDPDSEEIIIEIPKQLHTCCHNGGNLRFGPDGYLYITSGDDSNNNLNPDQPTIDYSMTDERKGDVHGRPAPVADAQRTSGNTADFRGSVHRIDPNDDGSYDIPDGNLKEYWEAQTGETYSDAEFRPELYVMGCRNPFIITHDEHTGFLYIADYGNDAPSWDSNLGTVGQATYHLFNEPGNIGHPFFKGYYPNRQYDFAEGESRQPFWPDNLRNRSRNNTGIENIPDVTPALVWHPQSFDTYTDVAAWADMPRPEEITWPQLDAGGSANAGVIYRYRDQYESGALDPYFDGKLFFQNPENADNIRFKKLTKDGSIEINEFLPDNNIERAHDMEVLSDGRLVIMGMMSGIHIIEYHDNS
jgi:hypothetical protein